MKIGLTLYCQSASCKLHASNSFKLRLGFIYKLLEYIPNTHNAENLNSGLRQTHGIKIQPR